MSQNDKYMRINSVTNILPGERFPHSIFHTAAVEKKIEENRKKGLHRRPNLDPLCYCETCGNWGIKNAEDSSCDLCGSDNWQYNFKRIFDTPLKSSLHTFVLTNFNATELFELELLEGSEFGGILETLKEMFSIHQVHQENLTISLKIEAEDYLTWNEEDGKWPDDGMVEVKVWMEEEQLCFRLILEEDHEEFNSAAFLLDEFKQQI